MNARAIDRRMLRNRQSDLSTVTLMVPHGAFDVAPPNPGGELGRMVEDGCWATDLGGGRQLVTRIVPRTAAAPPSAHVPAVQLGRDLSTGQWSWWQGARWLVEPGRGPQRLAPPGFSDLHRWVRLYGWIGTLGCSEGVQRRWLAEHQRVVEAADCAPAVAAARPAVALHYTVDVDDFEARRHVATALARTGKQLRELGHQARIL